MKSILSFLIQTLRRLFYNTPIRHWRMTEFAYARVGRFLIGNDPFPVLQLDGMKLKTNGQDVIVTAALANGNYEPFTLQIFRQLLGEILLKKGQESCVFLDVGANIGVFTVTAALLDLRVKVFAFEPNPISYGLLKENLVLNGLTNASAEQAAVGERTGHASLDISSLQAGMHSIYGPGTRRIEVPVISLGDFLSERNLEPAFIKVDVEGYEPRVLQGMEALRRWRDFQMILEFNPEHLQRGGKNPVDFLEELASRFDAIYCLDEIEQRLLPYVRNDAARKEKLISVGYNLLLIRGAPPDSLRLAET